MTTTRQEKRHPPKEEIELLKPLAEHIKNLILKSEELYAETLIQAWVYEQEVNNPTHMGKEKATENLGIYQKRLRYLCENIELIRLYAKTKNHDII